MPFSAPFQPKGKTMFGRSQLPRLLLCCLFLLPVPLESARAAGNVFAASSPAAESLPASSPPETEETAPAAAPSPRGTPNLAPVKGGVALTPFLRFLLDPPGTLTPADAVSPERDGAFQSFDIRALPRRAGSIWLKFLLAPGPARDGQGSEFSRLDLGDQVPGKPRVWARSQRNGEFREISAGEAGLYSLADAADGGEVLVRLDGLPGLWFAPALRTFSDALVAPERRVHSLALAALVVLILLCLLRSVTEPGDGRVWAGIFAGASLIQALCGIPGTPRGTVPPLDMPGLLAAAVALILLPHVGRNIMRTRETSPATDFVLLILALPGAALALLPLLPEMAWTAHLLGLWPLAAVFILFPALLQFWRGTPGSGLFSLACLGMAGCGGLSLWGLGGSLTTPLWGQSPLLGVVFATLLLAAAAPRSAYAEQEPEHRPLEHIAPAQAAVTDDFGLSPVPAASTRISASLLRMEEAMRDPLDSLLREACSLDQALEKAAESMNGHDAQRARRHADNLVAASRALFSRVADIPRYGLAAAQPEKTRQVFDLDLLVQDVFAVAQREAEAGGLALGWYIAPHLGRMFRGDRDRLHFILSSLLADSVRATRRGAICLRVRRADMSPNPGHLQFTVTDTGEGSPPMGRSSLTLARTWELAADHRGDLFVDSTPGGAEITFSLDCVALDDDGVQETPVPPAEVSEWRKPAPANPRLVVLASPVPLDRQMLACHLAGQGQEVWEARDAEEAVALYHHTPAALVILDGHLPEDDMVSAIAAIRVFEGEHGLASVPFLALALDETQAERMHQAGCDHSLTLPVIRGEFRAMALYLASPSGVRPRPSIVPYRIPSSRPVSAETEFTAAPEPPPAVEDAPRDAVETPPAVEEAPSDAVETPPAVEEAPSDAAETFSAVAEPLPPMPEIPAAAAETPPDPAEIFPVAEQALPAAPQPPPAPEEAPPAAVETPPVVEEAPRDAMEMPLVVEEAPSDAAEAFPAWGPAFPAVMEPLPLMPEIPAAEAETPPGAVETPPDAAEISPDVVETPPDAEEEESSPEMNPEFPSVPLKQPAWKIVRKTGPEVPPPARAQGFLIQPSSRPRAGRLFSLLKPTPKIAENVEAEESGPGGSEWVGKPVPIVRDPGAHTVSSGAFGSAAGEETGKVPGRHSPFPSLRPPLDSPGFRPESPPVPRKGRKKGRMEEMPFLSLDPDYVPSSDAGASRPEPERRKGREEFSPAGGAGAAVENSAGAYGEEGIVELTEAEMLESPLLQQIPDILRSLDTALGYAGSALADRDVWGIANTAARIADRAEAFGLRALADSARRMEEAAKNREFETAARFLADMQEEVRRKRRAG